MTSSEWERIKVIFGETAASGPAERQTALETVEPSVREAVEHLLASHEAAKRGNRLLDKPILNLPSLLDSLGDPQVFYPGQVLLERFEIVRLLGRGGMGEVYEAYDPQQGQVIAIKTIRFELQSDTAIRERFRVEAARARQVSHPNICGVGELFSLHDESFEIPFFTMEMLSGETLYQRIGSLGPLPETEALSVARQICAGLSAAHRAGLAHRDLKSSNVMLVGAAGGCPEQVKITDFGLARELPSDGDSLVTGPLGTASGTLAYMAPEILEGHSAGVASDIYSLGVVLYRMVTGRYPFEAQVELVSAAMRLRHPAPSPRKYAPQLSHVWQRAIMACLAGNPRIRPVSADEVDGLLQGLPAAVWQYRARVTSRQLKRREVLGAAVLALAGIVGVDAWWRWKRPPFAGREVSVLVEDFESPDPGGALGRAVRNMVQLAWVHASDLRVLRPDQVARAARLLNMGAVPLRGPDALRLSAPGRC